MATYEYQDENGHVIERQFRMGKARASVKHEGRKYTRAYLPSSSAAIGRVSANLHFVSHQFEPWTPGFARYDEHGRGLVDGRKEKDRFLYAQSKLAETGDAVASDGVQWTEDD